MELTCSKCTKLFKNLAGLNKHIKTCVYPERQQRKNRPKLNHICPKCNIYIKVNIAKHIAWCDGRGPRRQRPSVKVIHNPKPSKIINTHGGYRKGSGRGKSGWYGGYWSDSSWELAFIIYNLDHGIRFERNKEKFTYHFLEQSRSYIPDFIISGIYYEIKGYYTEQVNEKIKQFPHPLRVIDKITIQPYLDYVVSGYGKDFISLYTREDLALER